MKKAALFGVTLAAMAVPVMVQAQGVKLYGKVNVAAEHVSAQDENGVPLFNVPPLLADRTATWALTSYASRLGVKGDLDLEVGGLQGFYKAEYQIAVDDGANSNGREFSQRDIYAGLRGSFGELKAGRFNSPFKKSEGPVDQFNDYATDMGELMVGQDRFSNIIQYSTPEIADALVVNVAGIANENQDDFDVPGDQQNENTLADTVSASVVYDKGGLYAAAAISRNQLDDLVLGDADNPAGKTDTIDIARVALGLKVGDVQLGALYQRAEENDRDPVTGFAGEEDTALVSGALTVERFTFKAQHQRTHGDSPADAKALSTSVGVDFALGKMSKLYGYYGMVEIEPASRFQPTAELDIASVGLEHKF
jgi:predicted porin